MPTKVFFGRGMLRTIPNIIEPLKPKKILLITGKHFKSSTNFKKLIKQLNKEFNLTILNKVIKKSNFAIVNSVVSFCKGKNIDTIIAIGGGTILDVSKSVAILVKNPGKIQDFLRKEKFILNQGIRIIAVPTTAGTGSEVTPWATIWGEDDKKYSLSHKYMFPHIAIVDPKTTYSLPPKVTAESGIDALCQSIEAYWNINHNPVSDKYAIKAIKLIMSSLKEATVNGNKKYRDQMMLGSLTGGLAFSNTQTTICHAISYPISIHWSIDHGQATSLTLPLFIKQIFPLLPELRLKKILEALDSCDIQEATSKIELLMLSIGLKTKLSELGIKQDEIRLIVQESIGQNRLSNSPLIPSADQLEKLLLTIF